MLPNPLGDAPPPLIALCFPNDTSSLLYNPMILVFVTKAGRRGRHRQYAHARCTVRKGVGGIVSGIEDVGPRPGEDYITSLLLSTSVLGNLVEPQLCQSFPSLAPLHRQLHIIIMGDSGRLAIEFIYILGEHTCSFSSPSSFSHPSSIYTLEGFNWNFEFHQTF